MTKEKTRTEELVNGSFDYSDKVNELDKILTADKDKNNQLMGMMFSRLRDLWLSEEPGRLSPAIQLVVNASISMSVLRQAVCKFIATIAPDYDILENAEVIDIMASRYLFTFADHLFSEQSDGVEDDQQKEEQDLTDHSNKRGNIIDLSKMKGKIN